MGGNFSSFFCLFVNSMVICILLATGWLIFQDEVDQHISGNKMYMDLSNGVALILKHFYMQMMAILRKKEDLFLRQFLEFHGNNALNISITFHIYG